MAKKGWVLQANMGKAELTEQNLNSLSVACYCPLSCRYWQRAQDFVMRGWSVDTNKFENVKIRKRENIQVKS